MVAADRHEVAVAADDPYRQVRSRRRQPGRNRGRPTVDRVHAIGVQVIREPGRATDAGDADDVLALQAKLRQEGLDRSEDCVVTAAWAPAHLLVGRVVLLRGLVARDRHELETAGARRRRSLIRNTHDDSTSLMASVSSAALKGIPRTVL